MSIHPPNSSPVPTCIIVPAYNEAKRLQIDEFYSFLQLHPNIFMIFVDDGSTDQTQILLSELQHHLPTQIHVLSYNNNQGKAEAIRKGMLYATRWKTFQFIGYWDADLSTPLEEIIRFIDYMTGHPSTDLLMGKRKKDKHHTIIRRHWRHFAGRIFAHIVNVIFDLSFYDTQCGAKLMKSDLAYLIVEQPFVSCWMVDIEIILRLKVMHGQASIHEIPLIYWVHQNDSKIKWVHFNKILNEFFRVYIHYKY